MVNRDSFGQVEPTFQEDPLVGVVRAGDQIGTENVVQMGERFGNPFRLAAWGLISSGAGASVVADLAEGFEYLLLVAASDDANLLAQADVSAPEDINIIASAPVFSAAGAAQQGLMVEVVSANAANTSAAYVSFNNESAKTPAGLLADLAAASTTGNDSATLQLAANGEVTVAHTNGGDNSNGAFMLFWRELPNEGTPRFGQEVDVTP